MTSAISLNKRSRVLNFFTFTLKKQTPLTLLVTAFSLLICPGVLINEIMDVSSYRIPRTEMEHYFDGFPLAIFIISLGLMVLLTVTNFNFLYSKKSGDVFHALPLTRNELVLIRMLSSFIGAFFTMTVCYTGLCIINIMPTVIPVDFGTVAATFGMMTAMLFMCTVFTAIFAVCSGGVFDFIVAIGAVNLGIPAIYAIFLNFVDNNSYGVVWNNNGAAYTYTTPYLYAGLKVFEIPNQGIDEIAKYFWRNGAPLNWFTVIETILFTAICLIVLLKLFSVRRSETAGEAYSFKFVPHIISLLVSVVGGYLLAYIFTGNSFNSADFWFFFVIGAVLCSITAGAIFTRGFKTVKASLIRSSVAVGLTIILCVGFLFYGNYEEKYIPEKAKIELITVGYNDEVVFEDNFDIILDIHKAALDDMNDNVLYSSVGRSDDIEKYDPPKKYTLADTHDNIYFSYKLKNGREVTRRYYNLVDDGFEEFFIKYMQSEEYIARYLDFEGMESAVHLSFTDYGEDINYNVPNYQNLDANIGPHTAAKLMNAYAKELKNADKSVFYEACYVVDIYGLNSKSYQQTIRIPVSFTETRSILNNIDFSTDKIDSEKK